jgi:hypothetical protein
VKLIESNSKGKNRKISKNYDYDEKCLREKIRSSKPHPTPTDCF